MKKQPNFFWAAIVMSLLFTASLGFPQPAKSAGQPAHVPARAQAYFDDDRYGDLVVGVPGEGINGVSSAGAAQVLYGANTGLDDAGNQLLYKGAYAGLVGGAPTLDDNLGSALAAGDFNGDGFTDLAVGTPGASDGVPAHAGDVHIFFSSRTGVTTAGNYRLLDSYPAAAEDRYGTALASCDFNSDGYHDLAIGAPYRDYHSVANAGEVDVVYGASGSVLGTTQVYLEGQANVPGTPVNSSWFGNALACGDFNGDHYADLAIGIPGQMVSNQAGAGALVILYGAASGLSASGSTYFDMTNAYFADHEVLAGGHFAAALAAGDFNGDGYVDLAVSSPVADLNSSVANTGGVWIMYGTSTGLKAGPSVVFYPSSNAHANERYGNALAAGDFNNDGACDLAIGAPWDDVNSVADAGSVQVLKGVKGSIYTGGGLTSAGALNLDRSLAGIPGAATAQDYFGMVLSSGDFNGDHYLDLAIGVPFADVGAAADAGEVFIVNGNLTLLATAASAWNQSSGTLGGTAEGGDHFGYALAAIPQARWVTYLPVIRK